MNNVKASGTCAQLPPNSKVDNMSFGIPEEVRRKVVGLWPSGVEATVDRCKAWWGGVKDIVGTKNPLRTMQDYSIRFSLLGTMDGKWTSHCLSCLSLSE